MKHFWNEFKYQIILWLGILIFMIIIFPNSLEGISAIIQAQAVVTLVLITWYYAVQTKKQVNEQSKAILVTKNSVQINFLERRINEFYAPFHLLFSKISSHININAENSQKEAEKIIFDMAALFNTKRHMTSIDRELAKKFLRDALDARKANRTNFAGAQNERNTFEASKREFEKVFNEERNNVELIFRNYYFPNEGIEIDQKILSTIISKETPSISEE